MDAKYTLIGKQNYRLPVLGRQLLVCLSACVYSFMLGLSFGSPTVAVAQLRARANSTDAVSREMGSWIASASGFVAIPTVVVSVIVVHHFGRKKVYNYATVVSFVCFTILYCSKNATDLLVSRLFCGVQSGLLLSTFLMVMTESMKPRYRGLFFALKSASIYWGVWCSNTIGTFCPYNYIGIVGMSCSVINFFITFVIPETPFWLASRGRYEECAAAHRWLKGADEDTEKELKAIFDSFQKDGKVPIQTRKSLLTTVKEYWTIICQPSFYKPVSIGFIIEMMCVATGKLVFAMYAIEIIGKVTKNKTTAHYFMLILDGFSVLGMYMGCVLAKRLKRRTMLLCSSTLSAILMFAVSFYLYLVKFKIMSENNILFLSILVLYSLITCCGPMLLFSVICGELFPLKGRSFGVILSGVINSALFGLSMKFTPYLLWAINTENTFLFFAIFSTTCIILEYKYLPETKDKTLNEIAALFQ
ncbi:facilitated trehalose transporter Tret1-like [Ostrinia furnacalis]|uniref:facilitated trehalose transporter Tret1-like n=1 Tax=Ostrinia furnacalis TaxID=93504 RepID=UPI00103FAAB3|nr:facilitated trehalose transporter Tret1-like [Ostrinia furnacalis]